ncbi:MAG: hypothetical protein P4K98_00005, partial [Bryobacteraceae bacterium]|nr:hypothetical protein [Bryobacteraceae bacterium]
GGLRQLRAESAVRRSQTPGKFGGLVELGRHIVHSPNQTLASLPSGQVQRISRAIWNGDLPCFSYGRRRKTPRGLIPAAFIGKCVATGPWQHRAGLRHTSPERVT